MARPMSLERQREMLEGQRNYFDERKRWYAVDGSGKRIALGDTVKDFRGNAWIYDSVTGFPVGGKSGRIFVRDPSKSRTDPWGAEEFSPQACGLELRREG